MAVIPLHEIQEALRTLAAALLAPEATDASAVQAAVASLVRSRDLLPAAIGQLIDALFAATSPGQDPAVVVDLLDELVTVLHAQARPDPALTAGTPPRPAAPGPHRAGAEQLALF